MEKCLSVVLKKRLLRESDLTLSRLMEIARSMESAESQVQQISQDKKTDVSMIQTKYKKQFHKMPQSKKMSQTRPAVKEIKDDPGMSKKNTSRGPCYRCGKFGHFARDLQFPARYHLCQRCKKNGHFESKCRTKLVDSVSSYSASVNDDKNKHQKVRYVNDFVNDCDSDDEYIWVVNDRNTPEIQVKLNDCVINMLIDSGASCNIVGSVTWQNIARQEFKLKQLLPCSKKVFAYGAKEPMSIMGKFQAKVSLEECHNSIEGVEFLVVKGDHVPLLGRRTATDLGILHIGPLPVKTEEKPDKVHTIQDSKWKEEYKELFQGVGKLTNFQLKIHVDENVTPVAQPVRRIPYSIREGVEKKLDELLNLDIIEPVEGPTPWVSPVVCVPKHNSDEIRMCVDMRRANEAVIRERHPIPTVDEVLIDMNGSSVFSRLDLKWGYHQIELDPVRRFITTFITHKGLFRYKRLLFGVSCARECYQRVIQQVLEGCEGTHNISDDIIVYGKSQTEHDKPLHRVLQRIKSRGLTLTTLLHVVIEYVMYCAIMMTHVVIVDVCKDFDMSIFKK